MRQFTDAYSMRWNGCPAVPITVEPHGFYCKLFTGTQPHRIAIRCPFLNSTFDRHSLSRNPDCVIVDAWTPTKNLAPDYQDDYEAGMYV